MSVCQRWWELFSISLYKSFFLLNIWRKYELGYVNELFLFSAQIDHILYIRSSKVPLVYVFIFNTITDDNNNKKYFGY